MRRAVVARFLLLILFIALPAAANSARNVNRELVGIKTVALNISLQNLPGVDADALESQIRTLLSKSGVTIDPAAGITLFVNLTYHPLSACPDFVSFRTLLAISEEVPVRRGKRTESLSVDTWRTEEEFVEPKSKAGQRAQESLTALVKYLLDSAAYSTSVIEKRH
jgi:hypothetical protein